jgi:hypothetical protein
VNLPLMSSVLVRVRRGVRPARTVRLTPGCLRERDAAHRVGYVHNRGRWCAGSRAARRLGPTAQNLDFGRIVDERSGAPGGEVRLTVILPVYAWGGVEHDRVGARCRQADSDRLAERE